MRGTWTTGLSSRARNLAQQKLSIEETTNGDYHIIFPF